MATTSYIWNAGNASTANNVVTFDDQRFPSIASNPDGTLYLAAWANFDSGYDVKGRFFHGDGTPATNEFAIGTPALEEASVSVAGLADGRFVAVYVTDDDDDIQARLFNADGTFGQVIDIAGGAADDGAPDVTALADGGFAVSWTRVQGAHDDIVMSVHNADGSPRLGLGTVNSNANIVLPSSITGLSGGGFVVAWAEGGVTEPEVNFRRFDANGSALDGTNTQGVPIDTWGSNSNVQLAALPDGGFVVAYQDDGWISGDASDITAQVYNADGGARSSSFRVNSSVAGDQGLPTLAVMPSGHFVVGWQTNENAWLQVYDALGDAVGSNMLVESDSKNGDIVALNGSVIAHVWQGDVGDGSGDSIRTRLLEFTRVITGDGTDETITGVGDTIAEYIDGNGGHDTLKGGGGHDTLKGGAGDDLIAGGSGDDTAVFTSALGAHTIYDFGSEIVVRGEGFDDLFGIEHLRFANGTLNVVDDGNPLFDALYYLSRNPDVFQAGVDPLLHYNVAGRYEGRDPNAFFDTSGYLAANPDVAAAGINPLDHYHNSGWHEGRDPSAEFDTTLYLIQNPDVAAAGVDPLQHFLQYGYAEGRHTNWAVGSIAGGFDAQYYLFHNPDVAAAGIDPLWHFNNTGWHEGRDPNQIFDTSGYLAHNADVAAAGVNPLQHYQASGWHEGRDPSATFDTVGYLAANPDVAAAGINPLDHYLMFGIYEGRTPVSDGVWS
jgi:Ca2+-binding RTX toxin-like protein